MLRNPDLWQKLQAAPLVLSDGSDLGVVLASRYRIAPAETARLIGEYRRFLYLAATTGTAAPPTVIDQLWGLHREDAAAWQGFCRMVIGREIAPQRRPAPERDPAYLRSLRLIREEFGQPPSAEFWPDPESRAQMGAASLNVLFAGLGATLLVVWAFGFGWGAVALILTLVAAVERYLAVPSRKLVPRSDSGGDNADSGGGDD